MTDLISYANLVTTDVWHAQIQRNVWPVIQWVIETLLQLCALVWIYTMMMDLIKFVQHVSILAQLVLEFPNA